VDKRSFLIFYIAMLQSDFRSTVSFKNTVDYDIFRCNEF